MLRCLCESCVPRLCLCACELPLSGQALQNAPLPTQHSAHYPGRDPVPHNLPTPMGTPSQLDRGRGGAYSSQEGPQLCSVASDIIGGVPGLLKRTDRWWTSVPRMVVVCNVFQVDDQG